MHTLNSNFDSQSDATSDVAALNQLVQFHEEVISQIIGKEFFHVANIVHLTEQQVAMIHHVTESCRPPHRMSKALTIEDTIALLLPDYCSIPSWLSHRYACDGPVISVEIKPKQGFLPPCAGDVRFAAFCLKQFEKVWVKGVNNNLKITNRCRIHPSAETRKCAFSQQLLSPGSL